MFSKGGRNQHMVSSGNIKNSGYSGTGHGTADYRVGCLFCWTERKRAITVLSIILLSYGGIGVFHFRIYSYLCYIQPQTTMKRLLPSLFIALLTLFPSCGEKEMEIKVESVSINKPSLELVIGESTQLQATVSPSNATEKEITWSSSNPSIASVSSSGLVMAVKEGTAKISATAAGKKAESPITVKAKVIEVQEIILDKTELSLFIGEEYTIIASIIPENATDKTISWTTSNAEVATVDNGRILATGKGTAKISATSPNGRKAAFCEVSVKVAVESVVLNKTSLALNKGQSESLQAIITPEDASEQGVSWISSNPIVATVEEGLVTACSLGTALITVKTNDGEKTASCEVFVLDGNPLYSQPEMIDMGLPSGLLWASFNLGAQAPEEYGYYFAWGETEPKDYYEWDNYKWGTEKNITKYCDNDGLVSLLLEDDAAHVNLSGEWRLPTMEECQELMDPVNCSMEFTSINGKYVYVFTSKKTRNTLVIPKAGAMGIKLGDAGISGTAGCWTSTLIHNNVYPCFGEYLKITGKNASIGGYHRCVGLPIRPVYGKTPAIVPVTDISLSLSDVTLNIGSHETLTATVSPSYATNQQIVWTSSNSSIATVSNGKIVAVSAGNALITAATIDGSVIASCNVSVVSNTYNYPVPEAIDMGLSVKWASFNLGAATSEEDGYYYSWGETEPKFNYYWTNYKWCEWTGNPYYTYSQSWKAFTLTKYTSPSSVLEDNDDAAHMALGGKWRIPTTEERQELNDYKKCTTSWTTVNGVNGYLITSRITGNSIFLPATGYVAGSSYYGKGQRGYYWMNCIMSSNSEYAYFWSFSNIGGSSGSNGERCYGYAIRPVYAE